MERAKLTVCKNCIRYGTPVRKKRKKSPKKPIISSVEANFDIREDYPAMVKNAREEKGLTQKDLARTLNEKESVIHRIETGHMRPSRRLARKLEGALEIKLLEKVEEPEVVRRRSHANELTIGDIIKIKKR